ncbi:MAG: universal stress protein, partial [Pigmentiphaga sp.]
MSSSQQRPILVATDLSARSDRALDRALQLAQSRQCNLVVLYVIESSWKDKFTTPRWSRPIADVRELAQTRLQQILGAAATQSGVNIELMVKEGNTVQAIQEVA